MNNLSGRPAGSLTLNALIISDLQRGLLDGLSIKSACDLAGVSTGSFYSWRKMAANWQDIKASQQLEIFKYFNEQIEPVFVERERQQVKQREKIYLAQLSRLKRKQMA